MLIHGYLHRYDAVMMECCMISPVCSTAVLATNMDTGDRRVLQHSNTAYCEHGTLDIGDTTLFGDMELSNYLYSVIYSVYTVGIHTVRIYTPHTKTRQQKVKEPSAARGLGDKD